MAANNCYMDYKDPLWRRAASQRASVDDGLNPYVSAQRGSNKH